jgi:hypothetical protein
MTRERFINAREAAQIAGYSPSASLLAREDPQLRCWYAWAKRQGVPKYGTPRRRLYKRSDIERAIERMRDQERLDQLQASTGFDRMEQLAIAHARGEATH